MSVQMREKLRVDTYLSKRYKVIFWNDDRTTFDFVVDCLTSIFNQPLQNAIKLTIDVDRKGKAIAGTGYMLDIAKTKQNQVMERAKQQGFPFQVTVEEE